MSERTPLVGRAAELARLGEAAERARERLRLDRSCSAARRGSARAGWPPRPPPASELALRGRGDRRLHRPLRPDRRRAALAAARATREALDELRPAPPPPRPPPPRAGRGRRRERTGDDLRGGPLRPRPPQRRAPAIVVLDDLQWSDETTLELLAALAEPLQQLPVLVIAAYRSDGLPRDHRLRWLRNELRRGGQPRGAVAGAARPRRRSPSCWRRCCRSAPSPALVRTVHDRTMGSPFFVEELVARAAA